MRRRTRTGAIATAGLVSLALWAPTTATAAITEPFTGEADGEMLFVNASLAALSPDAPDLAEARVSTTHADADNSIPETNGYGRNLLLSLGGEEATEQGVAEQTAPPDNPERTTETQIDLSQADPLLTGGIGTSSAWARDPAVLECPDEGRTTVSEGVATATDLGVLNLTEFTGEEVSLISVTDGSGSGTLETVSGVYIGTEGQVIGESIAPAVQIDVAGSLPIEILDPVMTATATGDPGTASLEYSAEVRVAGETLAEGEENTVNVNPLRDVLAELDEAVLDELFGPLDEALVNELTGGLADALPILAEGETVSLSDLIDAGLITLEDAVLFLDPTVHIRVNEVDRNVAADGTSASGSTDGVVIRLTVVNTLTETETELVSLAVAALSASATVPAGGINCGTPPAITVVKGGPDTAEPGETFDYTIDVTNNTGCDATDVVVTDTITGPDGFTIDGTNPEADSIDGNVVTWEVGDLADGESLTFTVTVTVPEDATDGEEFVDTATVDGNCDGDALPRGEDTLNGPTIDAPVGEQSLPRTGGGVALLGLGAIAAAARLRRR